MSQVIESYALHWFRRDLRVGGNAALREALDAHRGRVLGVFFFDSEFLAREDFSHNRFGFFLKTLEALRDEMRSRGGDLLVLDSKPLEGFRRLCEKLRLARVVAPAEVWFNRDYEPFARERDAAVASLLEEELGIPTRSRRDHLLIEPHEILQGGGALYQIYSPFARRWFDKLRSGEVRARIESQAISSFKRRDERAFSVTWACLLKKRDVGLVDALDAFIAANKKKLTVELPAAGSVAAWRAVEKFGQEGLHSYADRRDRPAVAGTSRLSIYLKNGSLSVAQVISFLGLQKEKFKPETSAGRFLKELVWREFYYHILFHRPTVEHESFQPKYHGLKWPNSKERFEAWKDGLTGYPIVDAGMRQLRKTGWMHNRVRMIVASFLTKDLHVDWRWGERWFMNQLLDGDLASNNGGWQWAASTGCDPQPYFRIFNPESQSRKFDPDGEYIATHLPELGGLPAKKRHAPDEKCRPSVYPRPIVDHAAQRLEALRLYSNAATSFKTSACDNND